MFSLESRAAINSIMDIIDREMDGEMKLPAMVDTTSSLVSVGPACRFTFFDSLASLRLCVKLLLFGNASSSAANMRGVANRSSRDFIQATISVWTGWRAQAAAAARQARVEAGEISFSCDGTSLTFGRVGARALPGEVLTGVVRATRRRSRSRSRTAAVAWRIMFVRCQPMGLRP